MLDHERSVPVTYWTALHSERRDRLFEHPFRKFLTVVHLGELVRMRKFTPGAKVRVGTTVWLDDLYCGMRQLMRDARCDSDEFCKSCHSNKPLEGKAICQTCIDRRKAARKADRSAVCIECKLKPIANRNCIRCRECIDSKRKAG